MMNLTYPAVFGPVETNYSVAAPQTLHHIEAASSAKCYTTLFPHGTVSVPSQYYGTADYTKCPCNNGLTSIATAPLTECHQNATDFSQRAGAVWQTPQMLKPAESVYVAQLPSNLEVMGHGGNGTEAEQRTCHTESNCLIENGSLSFYHRELTSETPVAHSGIHNGSGVDLLVTNLDYNISAKEWRKILFTHLQAIIKNVQSVVLQTQADGSTCAIVRVGSVEEARLAISQFHRKKIGYKRIQMNIMPSTPSFGARGFKMEAVSLLRSVAGNMLPVCKFIDIFEKRFHRSISVSDIYKMRDILEIRDQPGTKGGRVVYLNPRASRFDYIETTFITEPVVCQRHCLEGSMEYLQAMDGAMLPSVKISLGVFRQQVLTILRDHGGSMPLLSFPACYKAEFDDFVIVPPQLSNKRSDTPPTTFGQPEANEDDAGPNHEFFSSHPEQETSTKSKSWSENRTDYEFTAPLEHLITCVPYVRVHTEMNGVRRIVYSPDQSPTAAFPNCPTGQRPIEGGRQSADVPTTIQSNYVPLTIGVSCTNSSTSAVGILQDQLHQFSREVVDLLKHQPECQILLSKFIPSYHHHFGKQCRVADYGYSKLHELIEALPHVVHVMGTGHARLLTLSHRVQVRRFTNELIKVLKSQSTKSCRLADYASLFKRIYRKDFRIRDYGVCYLTDMLMEVPDNAVETLKLGSEYIISLPKRMQTTEERERTELFAVEVAELLGQTPRCRLLFSKFIPSYHHHFSRQCRVADYGFTKLIDLLEAVPHVIQFRGNMSWTSGKGSFGTHDTWNKSFLGLSFTSGSLSSLSSEKPNVRTTPSKVPERSELSSKDVNSIRACSSDSPSTSTAFLEESHTIIALKPLILFARELRDILRQSQGKLSLAQLCNAYQRRFGIPLRPQRYNYPSLSSLVQAVDFVAVMRGRGVRSTLVLCQDFLGKLSHRVAYSNRPLLESDMVAIPRQGMEPHGNPGAGEENTGRKLEWAQSSNARHSNRINSLAFNEATSDDFVMTSGAIPFETPQRHFSMEPFPPESYDIPNPSCLRLRNYSCVPAFSQCNPYAPPITSSQIASSHYNCCQVPHPQQSSGSQSMYPNRPSYSTPMVLAPQGTLNYLQPTNEFVSTGLSPQTAYRANSSAVYAPSVFPTPTSQSESLTTLPSGSAVQPDPRIIGPGSEISSEGLPYSNSLFTNPSLSQFQLSLSCSSTMNQTGSQAQCAAQPPLISGLTHSIYPKPGTAAPSYGPNPVCLSVTSDSISYKQPPKTLSNHAASSTCQYSLSSDGYQQLDALVERLTSGGSATVSNGDFIQGKTKGNEQNKQQISSSMLPTESDNSSHSTQLKQHFYFSGHRASLFDYPTTSQYQAPLMSSVPNSINGSLPYWTGSPFNGVGAPMAVTSDNYSLCSTNAVNTSYSGASVGSFIPLLNQEGKDCGGGKQGALESGSATVMHYALANKTQAEPPREFDGHMPTQQLMVNMPRQCCNAVSSTNQSSLCANTREHMGSVRGPGEEVNLGCTFPRSETSKTPCHPNAALDIHHNESASIYTSVDGDGVKASGSVTPKNSEALAVPHPPDTTVHIDPMQPQANRSYAMSLRSEESSESFTIDGLLAELKLEERQEEPHQQKQEQEDNEQSQCSECVSEPKQNILLDNLTHL
ncbi:unnamed protein product [Dicrocoelium dendriticum]|nr:unnamed protein product [Dicrocoelium dendriticum]